MQKVGKLKWQHQSQSMTQVSCIDLLWPTANTVPLQRLHAAVNLMIKPEHKLKEVKFENIHHYKVTHFSSSYDTWKSHLSPLLDLQTVNIIIRSKLHFLKHPCPLLWDLASWTFTLSQNWTDTLCCSILWSWRWQILSCLWCHNSRGCQAEKQTQHCDPHSKAKELNCGRPSETLTKMGHLDSIQMTRNLN